MVLLIIKLEISLFKYRIIFIFIFIDLYEGLKRAQRSRLEDQRGTEINFELPDFLKVNKKRNLYALGYNNAYFFNGTKHFHKAYCQLS